jgi:hypothetical protein
MKWNLILGLGLLAGVSGVGSSFSAVASDPIYLYPGESTSVGGTRVYCSVDRPEPRVTLEVTYARYYTTVHTMEVRQYCEGRSYCLIDPTELWGDPAPGTAKGFVARFQCFENGRPRGSERNVSVYPVVTGEAITMACD